MRRYRNIVAALVAATFVSACGTPTERHVVGEIPAGQGLFTGDKGEIAIRRN